MWHSHEGNFQEILKMFILDVCLKNANWDCSRTSQRPISEMISLWLRLIFNYIIISITRVTTHTAINSTLLCAKYCYGKTCSDIAWNKLIYNNTAKVYIHEKNNDQYRCYMVPRNKIKFTTNVLASERIHSNCRSTSPIKECSPTMLPQLGILAIDYWAQIYNTSGWAMSGTYESARYQNNLYLPYFYVSIITKMTASFFGNCY